MHVDRSSSVSFVECEYPLESIAVRENQILKLVQDWRRRWRRRRGVSTEWNVVVAAVAKSGRAQLVDVTIGSGNR